MDNTTIHAHWPLARRALQALFPDYEYPTGLPAEHTFQSALEGLAIANDLTFDEVVESILDKMLTLDPDPVDQQSAA